jgi:hypothetical protein
MVPDSVFAAAYRPLTVVEKVVGSEAHRDAGSFPNRRLAEPS